MVYSIPRYPYRVSTHEDLWMLKSPSLHRPGRALNLVFYCGYTESSPMDRVRVAGMEVRRAFKLKTREGTVLEGKPAAETRGAPRAQCICVEGFQRPYLPTWTTDKSNAPNDYDNHTGSNHHK